MATPRDVLADDQREALSASRKMGVDRMRVLLRKAEKELEQRLARAEGLRGPGKDSFTASQLRSAVAQVNAVLRSLTAGMREEIADAGADVAQNAAANAIKYLQHAEQHFTGSSRSLRLDEAAIFDAAASGARASILRRLATSGEPDGVEPQHKAKMGILERYGLATVQHFEGVMQKQLLTRAPWEDVKKELVENSPFLQQAPAYWAERIARTETMGAHNRAHWESIREADQQLDGGMVKILSATFDDRTGADSFAVHGQIRLPEEPFESWFGLYQHPPNRPNDREVVVPHRIAWPIPPYLAWKSDSQIAARWRMEGRKTKVPPRPKMTTVPLSEFGKPQEQKPQASAASMNKDHGEPAIPPRFAKGPQAAAEEAPWYDPGIPEIPARGAHVPQAAAEEAQWEKPLEPEPAPELPPPELEKSKLTAKDVLATKDAPAKGSNEGGFYTGTDGVQRYAKFYSDPSQAFSEHLSNQVYRDLGLGAPESMTFEHEGKQVYASNVVSDLKTVKESGLTEKNAKQIMQGFAADVLLGNWDAVGTGLDNVGVAGAGHVMRIDNGGSLLFRAKAGRKPPELLNQITEWDKFLSGSNPYYQQVASKAGVTTAADLGKGLVDQIDRIKKLRKAEGGWGNYVERVAAGMPAADKKQVVAMLEARTKLLAAKAIEVKEATKKAKAEAKQAKAMAKEYAELAKKMGAAPPQTYAALPQERIAAQKHMENEHWFGKTEADYRHLAQNAVGPAMDHSDGPIAFTGSAYGEIRAHERNPDEPTTDRTKRHAKDIEKFFEKAKPAPPGTIYRGITGVSDETLARFLTEPHFAFNSTTSMSRRGQTAASFGGGGATTKGSVLFVIDHKTAVPVETISQHKSEAELLLKKGSVFRTKRRYRNRDGVVIEAEELSGEEAEKVRAAHAAALARHQ